MMYGLWVAAISRRSRAASRPMLASGPRIYPARRAGPLPAPAQLRSGGGLAHHDAAALRMPGEHPALAQPPGIARVAEAPQVGEAHLARAVGVGWVPRPP